MNSRDRLITEEEQLKIQRIASELERLYRQPTMGPWTQAAQENSNMLDGFRVRAEEVARLGQSASPPRLSYAVNVLGGMVAELQTLRTSLRSSEKKAHNDVPFLQKGTDFWKRIKSLLQLEQTCVYIDNLIGSAFPEVRLRRHVVDPNRYAGPSTSGAGPSRLPSTAAVPQRTSSPDLPSQSSGAPQQRANHPPGSAPTFGQGSAHEQSPKPRSPGR
jgi:hypothetical protein